MKHQPEDADLESAGFSAHLQQHLLLVLWQRKVMVFFGLTIGLILAALYYAQATPQYQSYAQVLVVKKRAGESVVMQGDQRVQIMEDYLGMHVELLKSPLVAEMAVNKHDLKKLPSLANSPDPASVIVASITAQRDKEAGAAGPSNIIKMSYRCTSTEDCKVILDAVIKSYQELLDETYSTFSAEVLSVITQGNNIHKKELDEKEKAYRDWRKSNPDLIWKGKDGMTNAQSRVASLEAKITQLLEHQADLRQQLTTFESAIEAKRPTSELLFMIAARSDAKEKPTMQVNRLDLKTQQLNLKFQEYELLERHGPQHPDVISIRKKIALLEELLSSGVSPKERQEVEERQVQEHRARLRADLEAVMGQLKSQNEVLDEQKKKAREIDEYVGQDEKFLNDIKRTELLFNGFAMRLQEINVVRNAGGFDARTISRPGNGVKVAPNLFQILAGGVILGFLVGMGLAYLAELSDKGFRTAQEIQRRLGLPVIGHIPLLSADPEALRKVKAGEATLDPFLCVCYRPKSVDSEAYRSVRTALYFSTQGGGHKVIQVTSPDMGDGKSTLATNLAVCIAQSGKKTIIVDADLRRPRMHRMFGLTAACGLAGVLTGQTKLREAIQPSSIPNLFVLPCGPLPANPAELLTSPRFQDVLEALRAEFDFVIVDTPPLLAVTDPCVVAPRVDGVVLTIRLSKKSGPKAERARELLLALGVKILGVVVNGVTSKTGSGRYGGGQYEYGYGQNEYSARAEEDDDDAYYEDNGDDSHNGKAPLVGHGPHRVGETARRLAAKPPAIRRTGVLGWFQSLWM